MDFCSRPPPFAADPRAVGSAVGLAPVEHLHKETISNTVSDLSDLPFPSYRTKYVKIVERSLDWVFMVLIDMLNVYLKSTFLAHAN